MNELYQTGELVMVATGIAAETCREYEEEWSNSFSTTVENVRGDGIDEGHTGVEVRSSLSFHPFQLIAVRLPDVRHAVDRRGNNWAVGHGRMVGQKRKQSQAVDSFRGHTGTIICAEGILTEESCFY